MKNLDKNPHYVTFGEAVKIVGKSPNCIRKYAERLMIYGQKEGRCTYFTKEDIETLVEFFAWGAHDLVARLEAMTGKKVELI